MKPEVQPRKVVVLSGSGLSAESGLPTFRDSNGLWNEYSWTQVASPEGWKVRPEAVLAFYNERRRKAWHASPNATGFRHMGRHDYGKVDLYAAEPTVALERGDYVLRLIGLRGTVLPSSGSLIYFTRASNPTSAFLRAGFVRGASWLAFGLGCLLLLRSAWPLPRPRQ